MKTVPVAALLLCCVLGTCNCAEIPVSNELPVAVPDAVVEKLKDVAREPGRQIARIEFCTWFHPNDKAVGVVHYADEVLGDRVIRRYRAFTNPNWPSRFTTDLSVPEYPKALRAPAPDWKPCDDKLTEVTYHRFTVGGAQLEVILGMGIDPKLAQELLDALRAAAEQKHEHMRELRLTGVEWLEVHDRSEKQEERWSVWFRTGAFSSIGIIFVRRNGRLVIDGCVRRVSLWRCPGGSGSELRVA